MPGTRTGNDVKAGVIRQFGDDTGAQVIDADFIRWINDGCLDIFRGTEENKQTATIPSVVGTNTYNLPANFYKAFAVTYDGTVLMKSSRRLLDLLVPTRPVGNAVPTYYYVISDGGSAATAQLVLYRTPDAVKNIVVEYQARAAVVSALTDVLPIPDAFFNTLTTYCLAKAKQLDGDLGAYQQLMSEFSGRVTMDYADTKDPYDDYYPFITSIPE